MCSRNLASMYSVKGLKFSAYIYLFAAVCLSWPNITDGKLLRAGMVQGGTNFGLSVCPQKIQFMTAAQMFKDSNICFKLVNMGHVLRKALFSSIK